MKQIYYGILLALLVYLKLNENQTKKGNFRIAALVGIVYILYQLFQDSNIEGIPETGIPVTGDEMVCSPSPSHCPSIPPINNKIVTSKWCTQENQGDQVGACYIYSDDRAAYKCGVDEDKDGFNGQCKCMKSGWQSKDAVLKIRETDDGGYECHDTDWIRNIYRGAWWVGFLPAAVWSAICRLEFGPKWLIGIIIYIWVLLMGWLYGWRQYNIDTYGHWDGKDGDDDGNWIAISGSVGTIAMGVFIALIFKRKNAIETKDYAYPTAGQMSAGRRDRRTSGAPPGPSI